MTKKTRRILFYSALFFFLTASYVTILYAQGYKYNFKAGRFSRTGTITLRANTDAKVFLNDELLGSTSLLTNSFAIDRLLPGQYEVRLQKDTFSPWQKKIVVEEGLVTQFPHILLLPTDEETTVRLRNEVADILRPPLRQSPLPTPNPVPGEKIFLKDDVLYQSAGAEALPLILARDIRGFAVEKDNAILLWWTNNELWVLWLQDTNYQPIRRKGDRELITRFGVPINQAAWFRGKNHIIVDAAGYKIVETDTRGGINIIKL